MDSLDFVYDSWNYSSVLEYQFFSNSFIVQYLIGKPWSYYCLYYIY